MPAWLTCRVRCQECQTSKRQYLTHTERDRPDSCQNRSLMTSSAISSTPPSLPPRKAGPHTRNSWRSRCAIDPRHYKFPYFCKSGAHAEFCRPRRCLPRMNYPTIGTPSQSQMKASLGTATTPMVGNSMTARQARPRPNTSKRPVPLMDLFAEVASAD